MSAKTNPKCPKCGGQFAVESKIRTRIPLGFGFAGSDGRFQVDVIETLSHGGFCLKCRKSGEVVYSKKRKTIYPKSINNKIKNSLAGR